MKKLNALEDKQNYLFNFLTVQGQLVAFDNKQKEVTSIHMLKAIINHFENDMNLLIYDAAKFDKKTTSFLSFCNVVDQMIDKKPKEGSAIKPEEMKYDKSIPTLLGYCIAMMTSKGEDKIKLEHILAGMIAVGDTVSDILISFNLTSDHIYSKIDEYGTDVIDKNNESNTDKALVENALPKYAIDLVQEAKDLKLDPVIGRDSEIRQLIQILTRRTKNNPVVVGEPGVGKTVLINALAQRIADDDVPVNLRGCSIYSLSITKVLAGAVYKGDFEDRMEKIIKEVEESAGKYILFIDEIHTIMESAEGQSSAADILKPALSRGRMSCIGATTYNEYQKFFEKDATMDRRFQKVQIEEPSEEMCITILRGLKERYENYHKVQITDDAIIYAVKMAKRYMPFRALPDSAIDLIDESCSKIRVEINSKPTVLDKIQREITTIEIAIRVLESDEDYRNKEKIKKLQSKLDDIKAEEKTLRVQWEREQRLIKDIQENKKNHERFVKKQEEFRKKGQVDAAAQSAKKAQECEENIKLFQTELNEVHKKHQLIKEVVTEQEVSEIISDKTGVPVTKIGSSEQEKLVNIEREIKKSVVGQDHAIVEIANAIRVNRVPGIGDKNRPIGSFMFAGTTGVGKCFTKDTKIKIRHKLTGKIEEVSIEEFKKRF